RPLGPSSRTRVYLIIDDTDRYGVGSSCPAVPAGSGVTGAKASKKNRLLPFRYYARFQVPKTSWLFICSHASAPTTRSNSPRTRVSPFPAPETRSVFHQHGR